MFGVMFKVVKEVVETIPTATLAERTLLSQRFTGV